MIKELFYKLQHTFNLEVFKKHKERLLPKFNKENGIAIGHYVYLEQAGNNIYDQVDLTNHLTNRSKNAIMYSNAMIMEICELITALGFKWWSVDTKNWVNVKESTEYKHLLEEYVDIGHFYMSLGHALGFTHEQIEAAYQEKLAKNYQRQEEGY